MPDRNGFMTPQDTHAEWVAAEAAQRARRDPAQLAGEPTKEEAAALAAADARVQAATTATRSAVAAVRMAHEAVKEPWKGATLKEGEAIADAQLAESRRGRDEEDARAAAIRLSVAISTARAARRAAAR